VVESVAMWARAVTPAIVVALALALAACGGSDAGESTPLGKGRQRLEPGTYMLDLTARDRRGGDAAQLPKIEITLPAGWSNLDGWAIVKAGTLNFAAALGFWDVGAVYPTPCRWAGKPMVAPGPTVEGLASALAYQPLRNATSPTDASLAGYHGEYLELSVPADVDFADCDEGVFESWTAEGWASDRYQQAPGQVDRLWILDVGGQRLVVDATYLPDTTAGDRSELDGVVRSIRFVD
jgi:hypothetical protein